MSYGASLQTTGSLSGIARYPWQWLVNDVEVNYLRISVDATVDGAIVSSEPTIDFLLPVVPALAVAVALLITRAGLPRVVLAGYLIGFAWAFLAYFPFRQLP